MSGGVLAIVGFVVGSLGYQLWRHRPMPTPYERKIASMRRREEREGGRHLRGKFTTEPRVKRAHNEEPPHGTRARYMW